MAKQTAKYLSVIFAGVFAGAALASMSGSAARAADDCLSGPKDQTPPGGHWYYRIERVTKRHCWYLGDEREKLSQAATPNSSPSATTDTPKMEKAVEPSFADAHAELPAQTVIEPPARSDARAATAMQADAAIAQNSAAASVGNTESQRSIVATRWPDPTDALASASPAPTQIQASPIVATQQFATVDSSSQAPAGSVRMLLLAIAAALALAAITAGVIFKSRRARRLAPAEIRARRDAIRASVDSNRGQQPDFPHSPDRADDRDERIAEFFAYISQRGRTSAPAISPAGAATRARTSSGRYGVRA